MGWRRVHDLNLFFGYLSHFSVAAMSERLSHRLRHVKIKKLPSPYQA